MPITMTFDSHHASTFEVQAAVLAILAWPDRVSNEAYISSMQVALCSHLMRAAVVADPDWALRYQWIKPVYLLQERDKVSADVARTMKRLHLMLKVARIARPFVAKSLGETPYLPAEIARLSLNAVAPWVLTDEGEPDRDAHGFEEKVVRRTYPVLHLALALEYSLHEGTKAIGKPPLLEQLMIAEGVCEQILDRAEALEPVMLAIREFRVDPASQVRVRLLRPVAGSVEAQDPASRQGAASAAP